MIGFLIVLRETLANFSGSGADDRVEIGVVVGLAAEDLDAEGALLEFCRMSIQGAFDYIAQETGISPAVPEERVGEDALQLGLDGGALQVGLGHTTSGGR